MAESFTNENEDPSLIETASGSQNTEISEKGDEDVLTPAEVLQELTTAWQNECFAPELLPHRFEIVDCVIDQLHSMELNLKRAKNPCALRNRVHSFELSRIRFVLNSYLRRRLHKIESHVHYYVAQDERSGESAEKRMSTEERTFAKEYKTWLEDHLRATTLNHLAVSASKNEHFDKVAPTPNLDSFVFAESQRENENVVIPGAAPDSPEEVIDMPVDSLHILPYKAVSGLVSQQAVTLM